MPPMPEGAKDGILKGMYVCKPTSKPKAKLRAQLFGSGAILTEALKAQQMLEEQYGVAADVWSVTSYRELYRDGHAVRALEPAAPGRQAARAVRDAGASKDAPGVFVAASDYLKVLPDAIDRWLPRPLHALGTDGFGRSETRAALRDFFEVDARFIVLATLSALAQEKQVEPAVVAKAITDLGINPEKPNPAIS